MTPSSSEPKASLHLWGIPVRRPSLAQMLVALALALLLAVLPLDNARSIALVAFVGIVLGMAGISASTPKGLVLVLACFALALLVSTPIFAFFS